ncbi:ABC transporter permease [Luteibacter aegosomatis]|uniref:ABC transporter permease n=1 Tax=Luteibacter aegosomatis TaxID=2911537 RepID=UPI001FF9259D|nr:ABC transporter permease [Luteibacter aegosomatis]UPG86964.1 ABC transporter permease [Luteibacter aegosomatis]
MFAYYLDMALLSLRRSKGLTTLMITAVALGIGACMTTLTVVHVLSGDPLPGRSDRVFRATVDPEEIAGYVPGSDPLDQVSWIDGMNLLHARQADRQALMSGGNVAVQPPDASGAEFYTPARYTTADLFGMFGLHFVYGGPWSQADDDGRARLVVITRSLNQKLFGGVDSTGRALQVAGADLRVQGVVDDWAPKPHFHDLDAGSFGDAEQVFMPLTTSRDLQAAHSGSTSCWDSSNSNDADLERSSCAWLQYWVELDSPAKRDAYREFLVAYSRQQHDAGRFQRPPNVRLLDVPQWLDYKAVVPGDVKLQAWLASAFLVVCLVNTVGLMLARFLRRSNEVSVRRALGASRGAIMAQLLVEAAIVGLAGGIGGLLLALGGLWLVRMQPDRYAALAHMDLTMLGLTFVLAVASTVLAGWLPAWRACRIAPALQLKSS